MSNEVYYVRNNYGMNVTIEYGHTNVDRDVDTTSLHFNDFNGFVVLQRKYIKTVIDTIEDYLNYMALRKYSWFNELPKAKEQALYDIIKEVGEESKKCIDSYNEVKFAINGNAKAKKKINIDKEFKTLGYHNDLITLHESSYKRDKDLKVDKEMVLLRIDDLIRVYDISCVVLHEYNDAGYDVSLHQMMANIYIGIIKLENNTNR